ncbi:MAG: hypothetical protein H6Q52_1721 [Deltaproteobacteria bacterium]|nr:hypothetical protein [Deltaproteobacteria bacterium]
MPGQVLSQFHYLDSGIGRTAGILKDFSFGDDDYPFIGD